MPEGNLPSYRICLIHPMDPRGSRIGGIETHVRLLLQYAPVNWSVLMVGVDGKGDCKLGEVNKLDFNGRIIDFLPIVHFPDEQTHEAAKSLFRSITMQFAVALVRNLPRLKSAIGNIPTTIELERFEFAFAPLLLGKPAVQVIHGEGSKEDKMDSLIKRYWFVHRASEEIAIRLASAIVCVNPNIETKIKKKLPAGTREVVFMPVPVDTNTFQTSDFDVKDGIFRVVFAGPLDQFKDPPTMFRALCEVHDRLGGRFEFHYVGTSDPYRYAEFEQIAPFTIRHGFKRPKDVAAIIAKCHAGVLTSYFEGMPCYLLEVLSVGRPIVAIRLPQYDLVVEEGVNGSMIERSPDEATTIRELADRFLAIWSGIQSERFNPGAIHAKVEPFSIGALLAGHFARHEKLLREDDPPLTESPSRSS